ncbi:MAG: D-alanine--D-alanine ligase [Oscillospiraceae bacterium]|jgi:D-alanine--(R)-lactate ligase|nr:D-alanine--D-alanine ligase [Oscillospiraceae bacterium]
MNKLSLLVLYGGASEEREVSIKSAREFARHLDTDKYAPIYVYIAREGFWSLADSPSDEPRRDTLAALSVNWMNKGLLVLRDGGFETLSVDVVFPMLHGKYGEDGIIQGVLEASGIPYVGCGVAASAVCMDKSLTSLVAAAAGVSAPRHIILYKNDDATSCGMRYPLFVKPARSGSSFGVSKVYGPDTLPAAVEEARRYDDKVLVEEAIDGREIGCAVLGNGATLLTGALDQIELSGGFFRIHQEANPERGSQNATVTVPAPIPESSRELAISAAKTVYRAVGCRGLARVDMFLTPDGRIVLNEINTMPGFTSYSRYPRMMASAGIPMRELIDRLVDLALDNGDGL